MTKTFWKKQKLFLFELLILVISYVALVCVRQDLKQNPMMTVAGPFLGQPRCFAYPYLSIHFPHEGALANLIFYSLEYWTSLRFPYTFNLTAVYDLAQNIWQFSHHSSALFGREHCAAGRTHCTPAIYRRFL